MIAGAIEEQVRFRFQLGVIEQSVRDCAVRSSLPLALGDSVVAGTMVAVVGTVDVCFLIVYANLCFGTPVLFMRAWAACEALSDWRVKNSRQDDTRKSWSPAVYRKRVPRAGKQLAGSPGYRVQRLAREKNQLFVDKIFFSLG